MRPLFHAGTRSRRRHGFTIIELLVVILLISVLIALSTGAVMKFAGGRSKVDTQTAMTKIQVTLHKRWQETTDVARKQTIPQTVIDMAGGDPERARVIWVKIQQRKQFPQSYAEVFSDIVLNFSGTNFTVPASPVYKAYLTKHGISAATGDAPEVQSSVCLLMALKHSPTGGQMTDEDFGAASNLSLTLATGGIPCLVDAWGNPFIFARWPIGITPLVAPSRDPSDPQGKLSDPRWWNTPGEVAFRRIHLVANATTAISGSRILSPTLASCGADGKSGLNLGGQGTLTHWSTATAADINDNLYNPALP